MIIAKGKVKSIGINDSMYYNNICVIHTPFLLSRHLPAVITAKRNSPDNLAVKINEIQAYKVSLRRLLREYGRKDEQNHEKFIFPDLQLLNSLATFFHLLQAICVKDISPNLKSCELLRDGTGTFQCKADVFLTLDSLDCLSA